AFCVALYEALAGERPFAGATSDEVRARVLSGKPPRPPARGPSWLRAAVLRGLAIDRDARFASMDALLAAIGRDRAARRRRAALMAALVATSGLAALGLLRPRAAAPSCDGGERRLARVWNPAVGGAVRGALLGTGQPYAGAIADRVAAGLDRYAGAWSAMHRD